jgi:hypothetical protein
MSTMWLGRHEDGFRCGPFYQCADPQDMLAVTLLCIYIHTHIKTAQVGILIQNKKSPSYILTILHAYFQQCVWMYTGPGGTLFALLVLVVAALLGKL